MKLFASECDIHLTKDGKVVVYHDDYYLGNTCFKDATYAELCAKGTLANGEKLPLLEEFIDVVLEGGCTQLWIDVKAAMRKRAGPASPPRKSSTRREPRISWDSSSAVLPYATR